MSDVLREGRIILGVEQKRTKLEAPDVGPAEKAFKAEKSAADSAATAGNTASAAIREHTTVIKSHASEAIPALGKVAKAHQEMGESASHSLAHAGHGILQLARGIALMTASSEADMEKLVKKFVEIEAVVDMAKGVSNLSHVAKEFGLVGKAAEAMGVSTAVAMTTLVGVASGVGIAVAALYIYNNTLSEVHKTLEEVIADQQKLYKTAIDAAEAGNKLRASQQDRHRSDAEMEQGLATTPQHRVEAMQRRDKEIQGALEQNAISQDTLHHRMNTGNQMPGDIEAERGLLEDQKAESRDLIETERALIDAMHEARLAAIEKKYRGSEDNPDAQEAKTIETRDEQKQTDAALEEFQATVDKWVAVVKRAGEVADRMQQQQQSNP